MVQISESAQQYFDRLIQQQDDDGLGLRISVRQAGTPHASCDLQFCPRGENQPDDIPVEYEPFTLYVELASEQWLQEAEIDFEEDSTGGQLTIRAPGIKGSEPGEDADIESKVQWILDSEINPMLASHGGMVSLMTVTETKEVVLQFGGGCQGCGMVDVTLKQGIEKTLIEQVPGITAVKDITDHQSGENPYYAGEGQGSSAI
jgi:Fe/S biogenesis protein NfuA